MNNLFIYFYCSRAGKANKMKTFFVLIFYGFSDTLCVCHTTLVCAFGLLSLTDLFLFVNEIPIVNLSGLTEFFTLTYL